MTMAELAQAAATIASGVIAAGDQKPCNSSPDAIAEYSVKLARAIEAKARSTTK